VGAQGTRAIDAARRAGITFELHEYAHDARATLQDGGRGYALEAVAALGIDAARVFKTIVVAVDGRLGIAIVPADGEVDLKAVADALGGRKAAVAPPAEAERATGYVLGGISPLGTRRALPTALDESAAAWPTIHVKRSESREKTSHAPNCGVAGTQLLNAATARDAAKSTSSRETATRLSSSK